MKCHKNLFSCSCSCSCSCSSGWTDRLVKGNSHFFGILRMQQITHMVFLINNIDNQLGATVTVY